MSQHTLLAPDSCLVCTVCHDRYQIALPQPLWAMLALVSAFTRYHEHCLTDETGDTL